MGTIRNKKGEQGGRYFPREDEDVLPGEVVEHLRQLVALGLEFRLHLGDAHLVHLDDWQVAIFLKRARAVLASS